MKILVVCQYYSPEPLRVTDICEELVRRGHSVTVVTGVPNYPMGEIYDGYRHGQRRDEVINGVRVHRCFTIGRRTGILFRFLNYYSYAISSARYVSGIKDEYDAVFVNQLSPVMMARAGVRYKKKFNKKLVMYCLDLWPESLVAGGIKRNSPIFKFFHRTSAKLYRQADRILVTSKAFTDYFSSEFGIHNAEYLPQYAEDVFTPKQCEKKPNGTVDLMFAGNVGVAQSVDTIIEAARLTKNSSSIRWHIVGEGSELENVKALAAQYRLSSVIFHERQPVEKMPNYYAMADAMLLTMRSDPALSMTLPGKLQTYMAAGKPIIGAIDGAAGEVIREADCGVCGAAEDAQNLADNALAFAANIDIGKKYSENSYTYYTANFETNSFFDRLEKELG